MLRRRKAVVGGSTKGVSNTESGPSERQSSVVPVLAGLTLNDQSLGFSSEGGGEADDIV